MNHVLLNGFTVTNLTNVNVTILEFLTMNSVEQSDDFTYNFLLNSSNENFAVHDYRVHRISQRSMDYSEFNNSYSINKEDALKELFMSPIGEHEFRLLTNKIKCGKITIEKLFNKHKEKPRFSLLRLLT